MHSISILEYAYTFFRIVYLIMFECCSLEWVCGLFVEDICSCHMLMHIHASFFNSYSYMCLNLLIQSLPLKFIFPWHPKIIFPNVILFPILNLLLLLLFLLKIGSMTPKTLWLLRRTFLYFLFFQNDKYSSLSLQTMVPNTFKSHGWEFLCEQLVIYPGIFI